MAYGFGSILPAVTVAHVFAEHFHFSTLSIGLAYGGALTIGGVIGEFGGGIVVDRIINKERLKRGRNVEPEARLKAIWTGELLVPVSLVHLRMVAEIITVYVLDWTAYVWIWRPV
ncbi:hypothetical protein M422DRAFT_43979 [Sphaerobolus stellatus SS14]|nr:hypothetical protein M422DRAFT_43979 [Sphaerobolus stellatus SS14]